MSMGTTQHQIELLQHTLGLRVDSRTSYRNYFVAGKGHHDMPALQALESLGLMRRASTPAFCHQEDIVFCATDAGRALAIEALPEQPKRTRYEDFLTYDGSISFGQYLCGNQLPLFERRSTWDTVRWRMVRYSHGAVDVAGDWSSTKKAAKASYKQALAAHRRLRKEGRQR